MAKSRIDALYEFQEKVDKFVQFLDDDGAKSVVTLSDPSFTVQAIGDAVDSLDALKKWIDREVKKYEAFL